MFMGDFLETFGNYSHLLGTRRATRWSLCLILLSKVHGTGTKHKTLVDLERKV